MYNVIRVEKVKNYTIISNVHLLDETLSLKAKGLMTLLLALPNDEWELSINGLAKLSKDQRDSVASTLTELESSGYLVKKQRFDANNRFNGYEYTLYEHPCADFPYTEFPFTEKPQQLNTNILNTNLDHKDINNNINNNSYFNDKDLDELFNEFIKQRKKLKAVNSDIAIKQLVNKIYKYSEGNKEDALEIISQSIENSWKGVFPLKKQHHKPTQTEQLLSMTGEGGDFFFD